jgi:hypothetical protein
MKPRLKAIAPARPAEEDKMPNEENSTIVRLCKNIENDDYLHKYEIEILGSVQGTFIPALSFLNTEETQSLIYNCAGLVPLSKTRILTLPKLFAVLRILTATLINASDKLLPPSGFLQGVENIFFDVNEKMIKLIYGGIAGKETLSISDYMKIIIVRLPELFPELLCIKDVTREMETKIKTTNPSPQDMMKIIGICERKWAQILP